MEIIGDKRRLFGLHFDDGTEYSDKFTIHKELFFVTFPEAKIVLDDTFLEKFKKEDIVVNCETEEEAKEFCNFLHSKGYRWNNSICFLETTCWSWYKEHTCYEKGRYFRSTDYFEDKGYTIIKFKDCVFTPEKRRGEIKYYGNL